MLPAAAAAQVGAARALQWHRAGKLNVELAGKDLREFCGLDQAARQLLGQLRSKFELSARGVHRVLRVARTIADLDAANSEPHGAKGGDAACSIAMAHLAEALQLRRAID